MVLHFSDGPDLQDPSQGICSFELHEATTANLVTLASVNKKSTNLNGSRTNIMGLYDAHTIIERTTEDTGNVVACDMARVESEDKSGMFSQHRLHADSSLVCFLNWAVS